MGPRTVPGGTPQSIDIYELCGYSINHDPLFSLTQEVKDPVDQGSLSVALSLSERM